MISPVFSLTIADLSPAALAGKTLNCTIDFSAAPFATNGTWTATFETSPADRFTIHNVTGDTVDGYGTVAFKSFADDIYTFTVTPFIHEESPCTLYLWVDKGVAHYEVELVHGAEYIASEGGTFTFGSAPKVPEITVKQPADNELSDSTPASKRNFGTVKTGSAGTAKIFTIKNTGKAPLTGLAVRKDGLQRNDYVVGTLGKTTLPPGASTMFPVTFKPTAKGTRVAAIHVASNDANENPFDIQLTGVGSTK